MRMKPIFLLRSNEVSLYTPAAGEVTANHGPVYGASGEAGASADGAAPGLPALELGDGTSSGGNTGEPARGESARWGSESSVAPGGGCFSQAVASRAMAKPAKTLRRTVETNTMNRVFPQPRRASQFSVGAGPHWSIATAVPRGQTAEFAPVYA